MSFSNKIGFSKSIYNLNEKIKKNNNLKKELSTGQISIFRNQNQYRNASEIKQKLVQQKIIYRRYAI